MRIRSGCLVLVLCLSAGTSRPCAGKAEESSGVFDFVYAEPNSGAASGGHVAVQFGDVAFHFQYLEPGLIRSVKEPSSAFAFAYRGLGNRGLRTSRVRVSADSLSRLRDSFERRHLVQESQIEALEGRRRDRGLLEFLRAGEAGAEPADWRDARVPLAGAGYFYCGTGSADGTEGVRVLEALRRRVRERYGGGFLERRAAELRHEIETLDPSRIGVEPIAPFSADVLPAARPSFAHRYRELLQAWLAIDVLRNSRGLGPEVLRTSAATAFELTPEESAVLRARADELSRRSLALLESRRPDWGYPLLIALGRRIALERSLESGRLVVLDTYAEDAESLSAGEISEIGSVVRAIRAERDEDFREDRDAVLSGAVEGEAAWSRLETNANLLLELDGALDEGRPLRGHPATPLPAKDAMLDPAWPIPRIDADRIEPALESARAREGEVATELSALYRYDVVARNCVTEVFDTIDGALGAGGVDSAALRDESGRRLGGYVGGQSGFNFIPRVALRSVDRSYRVGERLRQPSYRRLELAKLDGPQGSILARWRESNTLTSTLYRPHLDDGVFLFFTDGAVLARPLLGGVNLLAATGAALVGIATSPFDRGTLLYAALRGVVFSLPEIAFVNIRKGSLPVLPRRWVERDAQAREAPAARS